MSPPREPARPAPLEVLARIASGLCRDARISRVELAPDDRWSFAPATRTLRVGASTLATGGIEVCAGILAHEVGHAFLSRYHLLPRKLPGALAGRWLNAIEDPRVEAWMAARYPGVGAWLDAAAWHACGTWTLQDLPALRTEQWCLGACLDAHPAGARILAGLAPSVRRSLDTTIEARRIYRDGFLPPVDLGAWVDSVPAVNEAYEALHRRHALPAEVYDAEKVARLLAVRAWEHACAHILPTVQALHAEDLADLARLVAGDEELKARLWNAAGAHRTSLFGGVPAPEDALKAYRDGQRAAGAPDDDDHDLARVWYAAWQDQVHAQHTHPRLSATPTMQATCKVGEDGIGALRTAAPGPVRPTPPAALVGRLETALRRSLRQERKQQGRARAHQGVRADLRRVMVNDGVHARDPSRWQPAWQRATPTRHDAAFALLIDCSGSMRGERIEAAMRAAEVFAEALARVGAPFVVAGFQDDLFVLATQDATPEQARSGIAEAAREVSGTRPAGRNQPQHNDDGPCLLAAAQVLRALHARQRVLVVLSDGVPAGRRSDEADLVRAVQTLSAAGDIDLIGMGIGEGATHIARFYPRHVVVPAVAQLPEALVRVLAA